MLDIKFVRENPETVKQNIRNKFQDQKLPLVDEVLELDAENRRIKQEVESLRAATFFLISSASSFFPCAISAPICLESLFLSAQADRVNELSEREKEVEEKLKKNMMIIPNIIDPSVPIGKDDSENVVSF